MEDKKPDIPNILYIGFADNRIPEFKEVNSKDWILFGSDNLFPKHLLYLYNKSSNHAAIVNGKVTYITGKGFPENFTINSYGEKINKILKKISKDIEIFAGFYLQVSWNKKGKADVTHVDFMNLRKDKSGQGYWFKKDWTKLDVPVLLPNFNPKEKTGNQIFSYMEYRPGCKEYPLPGYFAALNDIETDAEISKYNLSTIKNGMFGGKMITFHTGDPGEEGKKKLEKGMKEKFTGSEKAGNLMLVFGTKPELDPTVQDMSTTDLDKLFDLMNKTVQAEIFSGHQVTSPMLFGVMEPGKLGGRNEMQDSYEIFKSTYINDKQMDLEEVIDFLGSQLGWPTGQKILPVEPLTTIIDPKDFINILPSSWVLEKLGIDPAEYPDAATQNVSGVTGPQGMVNEHIKGLSGRENQNLMRIIRQYKKGYISRAIAETMLSRGYNLPAEDINNFLQFAAIEQESEVAEMFSFCGVDRSGYTVVKSKPFKFEKEHFADINQDDSNILDLIKKDKKITPEVIANTLNQPLDYVKERINSLRSRKVITTKEVTVGIDTIIESSINQEVIDTRERPETVSMYIKYSYEPKPGQQPIIETTRPFCRRLIELDKLYTRAEIESISKRVGYSVFDRKGGFWGNNDECRHNWVSNVVIKKNQ
jgi:hypothetical protein